MLAHSRCPWPLLCTLPVLRSQLVMPLLLANLPSSGPAQPQLSSNYPAQASHGCNTHHLYSAATTIAPLLATCSPLAQPLLGISLRPWGDTALPRGWAGSRHSTRGTAAAVAADAAAASLVQALLVGLQVGGPLLRRVEYIRLGGLGGWMGQRQGSEARVDDVSG
jgi:hypothetical protein